MKKLKFKKIKSILTHQQIYTLFNKENLIRTKETVSLIERQIKNNKKPTEKEVNEVIKTINFLINTAIQKSITPIFRDLINEFIVLIALWNDEIAQSEEIKKRIHSLRNFIDYHLSVIEIIQELKPLLEKIKEMKDFNPPVFDLSKHYLNYLQKEKGKK